MSRDPNRPFPVLPLNDPRLTQNSQILEVTLEQLKGFRIERDKILVDESSELGRGGFGYVHKGVLLGRGTSAVLVAVKRFHSSELQQTRVITRLLREMKIWSKLQHRNILPFIGFYMSMEEPDQAMIICPFITNGSADRFLVTHHLDDAGCLELVSDALEGLKYLHGLEPPIAHGDIKAANLLVGGDGEGVLCDYGLSKAPTVPRSGISTSDGLKGSIAWCSPELLMGDLRSPESDIWAWGCLVLEIMKRKLPYYHCRLQGGYPRNMAYLIIAIVSERKLPALVKDLDQPVDLAQLLLDRCWVFEKLERAGALECVKNLALVKEAYRTNLIGAGESHGRPQNRAELQLNRFTNGTYRTSPKPTTSVSTVTAVFVRPTQLQVAPAQPPLETPAAIAVAVAPRGAQRVWSFFHAASAMFGAVIGGIPVGLGAYYAGRAEHSEHSQGAREDRVDQDGPKPWFHGFPSLNRIPVGFDSFGGSNYNDSGSHDHGYSGGCGDDGGGDGGGDGGDD